MTLGAALHTVIKIIPYGANQYVTLGNLMIFAGWMTVGTREPFGFVNVAFRTPSPSSLHPIRHDVTIPTIFIGHLTGYCICQITGIRDSGPAIIYLERESLRRQGRHRGF
jgi:hypothetical protein